MKAVFADTFYWVALSNPADHRYRDALAFESELAGSALFTTDEVLSEFLTFFAGGSLVARTSDPSGEGSLPKSKNPRCPANA